MDVLLRYRGRVITTTEVEEIRELIAANPGSSRRALSEKLCRLWQWAQPNGQLCSMLCRSLMLQLHRAGLIELPEPRWINPNPLAHRRPPRPVAIDSTPVQGRLSDLGPLEFRQVRRTAEEPLFGSLIQTHHYLGYTQPVGEHLKYLIYARGRPIACFAWSSAPRHLGPRDRYIGWSAEARRRNIHLVAYNSRFLILPWVEVPHLASHLLGRMVRRLPQDWQHLYEHPVLFAETFVDSSRFRGTCYRAANWVFLGRTTGRGKNDQTKRANRPIKDVLGYPLNKHFRQQLSRVS